MDPELKILLEGSALICLLSWLFLYLASLILP